MRSARTAAVLTGLSLALPGAALAQSPTAQSSPGTGSMQNAKPLTSSAPASASSSPPSSTPSSTAPPSRRLPSTGVDAGLLVLAGIGLVLTGAGLRLRLPEPSALPE